MDRVLGALTAPILAPWALATFAAPRSRQGWSERWGLRVAPVAPGAVWVHASSVGEAGSAAAIARALPDPVLVTCDTDTGVARARVLLADRPGIAVGAKPVDHPWTLAPLWAEARPRAVVFVEGTFWPALAWRARRYGVPVIRAAAKSGRRTQAFGPALRAWWWPVDAVLARDRDAAAFLAGVHRCPVEVVGDPKGDGGAIVGENPLRWSRPFAVVGCARDGDVERVMAAMDRLDPPRPALLVAPRHPERFDPGALAGRRWVRRSALADGAVPDDVDAVVLDTVGELGAAYRGAAWALIGGTFDPAIGGHSPYEAASVGVSVVAGPAVAGQGAAFAEVGASIAGSDDPASLAGAIRGAKAPRPPARGAAARIAARIGALAGPPAPETSPRPWLAPAAAAVGALSAARAAAHRAGWTRVVWVGVPVIGVGSSNARSPGRTSTVRAVVDALAADGCIVGVSVDGYRRSAGGRGIALSTDGAGWQALGDEGALLAACGATVAAGPDRLAAARALVGLGVDVIVVDDGARQRGLGRDLELAVIDARYPGARGLLPAGERRELAFVPDGAVVLVHHAGAGFAYPGAAVERRLGAWVRGDGGAGPPTGPVAAFAGIGRPAALLAGIDVPVDRFLALPDHAPLDAERLARWAGGLPLVCTSKDAVRLPTALRARAAWREVEVALPDVVRDRVRAVAGEVARR